jgi:DHA1 family bicyclomycin/chloramphenicol resistance-like MFS transporter
MTKKQHFIIILILGALSTISPFSIDMYLPAFPSIAADLNTSVSQIQLSLTSYFIGIAAGQLIYGPLLDRFGRRIPLYIGLSIYIVASLLCAVSLSADQLIALRLMQALGGCASMVASRALVRDIFPVSESAKIFSYLMLVLAVSPMIAPTVGGYVSTAFGWHSVFIILAVITGLILLASVFYLPAGRPPDPTVSLRPRPVVNSFISVLRTPQFYTYAVGGSFAAATTYAYISGSPAVFMGFYHIDERTYGWIFAFIAAGIIGSSQVNRFLLKRFESEKLIFAALVWQVSVGLLLVLGTMNGWYNSMTMTFLIFLFLCGQGFIIPNSSALSLAPFSQLAGTASALLGALQLGFGAVASAVVSVLHNRTAIPMSSVMLTCVILSLLILFFGHRNLHAKATEQEIEEYAADIGVR